MPVFHPVFPDLHSEPSSEHASGHFATQGDASVSCPENDDVLRHENANVSCLKNEDVSGQENSSVCQDPGAIVVLLTNHRGGTED